MSLLDMNLLIGITSQTSPSGYEKSLKELLFNHFKNTCKNVQVAYDSGELYTFRLSKNPNAKTILFDAHIDQVSCRVFSITSDGFLLCKAFGTNNQDILGKRCIVLTKNGNIPGIITIIPPHLNIRDDSIIVDIFAENGKEAKKMVEVGDSIVFDRKPEIIREKYLVGTGLDNHVGIYTVAKLFLEIDKMADLDYNLIAHYSSREEVGGLRYINMLDDVPNIPKRIDLVFVVDTDVATDLPNINHGDFPLTRLNSGPILTRNLMDDHEIFRFVADVAEDKQIDYQVTMSDGNGGNNLSYYGKLSSLGQSIGIPLRYMHSSVELVHLDDVDKTIRLLIEIVNGLPILYSQ
jgi:endoglucanase